MKIFDTQKIGQKIAKTRKEQNFTQLELADALGVSYQAVSNWERGQSMPDIEKLPELANFLHLSLDDLLGGVAAHEVQQMAETATISEETLVDVAPLLKPQTLNEKVQDAQFSLNQLVDIAPYLSQETLHTLVKTRTFTTDDLSDLEEIAPYLNPQDLFRLMIQFSQELSEEDYEDLEDLISYLTQEHISELFTFLSQDINDFENLESFYSYVPSETLLAAAKKFLTKNPAELDFLEELASFLAPQEVGELFLFFSPTVDLREIEDLAPFVEEKFLLSFLQKHRQKNPDLALSDYEDFFAYLSEESLLALLLPKS